MPATDRGLLVRVVRRARRITNRARERVRGLPLRAIERKIGRPVPPGRLIHLVANTEDVAWFLDTGALAARSIRETLAKNGLAIEAFGSVLDFGCGVGRVIRQWSNLNGPTLHGTDYNPAWISWCRRRPLRQVRGQRPRPPAGGRRGLVSTSSMPSPSSPTSPNLCSDSGSTSFHGS